MRVAGYLPGLVIITIILLMGWLDAAKHALSPAVGRQITASIEALKTQQLALSSRAGAIDILPAEQQVPARVVSGWLQDKQRAAGFYTYGHRTHGVFTGIAYGVDHKFHVVHDYLEGYQPFQVENPMLPMLVIAKRKTYKYDHHQYNGLMEVWQSSRQAFLYTSGDCEDHAILLADWLIEMGLDARVALGDYDNNGHAWVVLFKDGKEYVLEATQKRGFGSHYPLASMMPKYHPEFMFNRENFWRNTGSKYTSRYSGAKWLKVSRYYRLRS